MPKLLRAVQPTPIGGADLEAAWEVFLNDGIPLKPHARVGLRSIIVPYSARIEIDGTNDRFNLRVAADAAVPPVAVRIAHGRFPIDDFLMALRNAIAEALTWRVANPNADRFAIGPLVCFIATNPWPTMVFKTIRQNAQDFADGTAIKNNVTYTAGGTYYSATANPAADGSTYVCDASYFVRSSGFLRTQLLNALGTARLALVQNFAQGAQGALPKYHIRANGLGGNYYYKHPDGGFEADSLFPAIIGDFMEIDVSGRKVRYSIWRGGAGAEACVWSWPTAADQPPLDMFDLSEGWRPLLIFYDAIAVGVRLFLPRYTQDPELTLVDDDDGKPWIVRRPAPTDSMDSWLEPAAGYEAGPLGALPAPVNQSRFTVAFPMPALKTLLGFNVNQFQTATTSITLTTAVLPLDVALQARGVVVELPSLPQLESWDGATSRRRPILAVIPANITDGASILTHECERPTMLGLGNAAPMVLRNLLIRIYFNSADEELVDLDDACQVTLVFEDD